MIYSTNSIKKHLSHLIFFDIISDTATLLFGTMYRSLAYLFNPSGEKNPNICISASKYMHVFKITPVTPEIVLPFYFPIRLNIYILFKIPFIWKIEKAISTLCSYLFWPLSLRAYPGISSLPSQCSFFRDWALVLLLCCWKASTRPVPPDSPPDSIQNCSLPLNPPPKL